MLDVARDPFLAGWLGMGVGLGTVETFLDIVPWWLNNGDWWKSELGSALSLSHPSGSNVLAWSRLGGQDMVLHLPALPCPRYRLDAYVTALVTAIELSVHGTPFTRRTVKYSCCNLHYTEMTLWQVSVCLSSRSTCGCELSTGQGELGGSSPM